MTEGGAVIGPCGWRSMDLLPGCPKTNLKDFMCKLWSLDQYSHCSQLSVPCHPHFNLCSISLKPRIILGPTIASLWRILAAK